MNRRAWYLIGFIVIAVGVCTLFFTSFQSSLQYYVTVSELKTGTLHESYNNKILKVAGKAHELTVEVHEAGSLYQFVVEEGGSRLPVRYRGFVPDTFKEGSDVVVTGQLASDGVFNATEILAKCASKYEAKIK